MALAGPVLRDLQCYDFGIKENETLIIKTSCLRACFRVACRTGVIFCIFQRNRGEREASAKRELRERGGSLKSPLSLASLSPLFARSTQKLEITPVLFCRLVFAPKFI